MQKLFLICVLLFGCSQAIPPDLKQATTGETKVFIESEELTDSIEYAVNFWNSFCPSFILTSDRDSAQVVVSIDNSIAWGDYNTHGLTTVTRDAAGKITFCDVKVSTDSLKTMSHEFGHCLGLEHILEGGFLMSHPDSDSFEITEDEIQKACP